MVRHQNCNEEIRRWVLFSVSVLHPVSSARTKRVHLFARDQQGRVQSLGGCQKFKIQLCLLLGLWRRRRIQSPANAEKARGTCERALLGGGLWDASNEATTTGRGGGVVAVGQRASASVARGPLLGCCPGLVT